MRVIAGQARSLKLIAPEGMDVRPTTDRTKETLFNKINNRIPGSIFLDLFSGTGALGIEALSRGAKLGYFIENAPKSIACIEENLKHTKLMNGARLLKYDYLRALQILTDQNVRLDLIFMDPPYRQGFEERAISFILEHHLLEENGLLVCESAIETSFDFIDTFEGYEITDVKAYKTNKFTFIKRQ